jgi:hypothetical protein
MLDNDSDNKTQQMMLDLFAKALKTVKAGVIDIDMKGKSALRIEVDKKREKINLDFIHPTIIQVAENENGSRTGLFDKLKMAKEFSQKLTDNGLTLSFLRKGKEAITLGKEANPTLSKFITRSDDIQVDSVRESIKLGRELKSKEKK